VIAGGGLPLSLGEGLDALLLGDLDLAVGEVGQTLADVGVTGAGLVAEGLIVVVSGAAEIGGGGAALGFGNTVKGDLLADVGAGLGDLDEVIRDDEVTVGLLDDGGEAPSLHEVGMVGLSEGSVIRFALGLHLVARAFHGLGELADGRGQQGLAAKAVEGAGSERGLGHDVAGSGVLQLALLVVLVVLPGVVTVALLAQHNGGVGVLGMKLFVNHGHGFLLGVGHEGVGAGDEGKRESGLHVENVVVVKLNGFWIVCWEVL